MNTLLIQNGLLVDTEWTRHADVLVQGSKIAHISTHIDEAALPKDTQIVNAHGLCLLPGLIDAHTHYHLVSRGTVTADSFQEGSKLAAYGGVTTVIDFADDDKKGHLEDCAEARIQAMSKEMAIDFSLHQGVYAWRDSLEDELSDLKDRGIRTLKLFTTYKNVGYMIDKKEELRHLFKLAKELDMMICVHCEDDATIERIDKSYHGPYTPPAHAVLRPSEAEAKAIETVGLLAGEIGMPLYIVHLSSKKGLEMVRSLREKGVRIIVETTPTYLFLDKSKLEGPDGALYVMTPPLRSPEDNEELQEAVLNGEVQVIATDHCSFTREQKLSSNDCRTIYPGIPGTEELLPLVHTFAAHSGRIGLQQVVNLLSTGPAKAFGLFPRKGVIKVGSDADIVLFDPDETWTLGKESLHSASGYSAYEGTPVLGKVKFTYSRGRLVMGDNIYLGISGNGKFIGQGDPAHLQTILH